MYVPPGNGSPNNRTTRAARPSPDPENTDMEDLLEKYTELQKEVAQLKKELAKKGP